MVEPPRIQLLIYVWISSKLAIFCIFISLVFLNFHFFSLHIVVSFCFLKRPFKILKISCSYAQFDPFLFLMFQFWCFKAGTGIAELIALEISKQVLAY